MLNVSFKTILLITLSFLLTSCGFSSLLKNSYTHLALEKHAKSNSQPAYIGTAYDVHDIHNALFSDFLIIGKSSLTAKQGSASDYTSYGKKIGADVVIVSFQNKHRVTEYITLNSPDDTIITEDTVLKRDGYGREIKSKKITVRKDQDTYIPYTVTYFDQEVLFLKRIGSAQAPWEYTQWDFTFDRKDSADQYLGDWIISQACKMEIYSTESEYLGFIRGPGCKEKSKINKMLTWQDGDIRLRINKQSKQGFYLNKDKNPILIKAQINKSNYLELVDQNSNQVIIYFQKG